MTAILLQLDSVCVDLPDGRRLLTDVHLSVRAGDRVALMGPSGSGKSTLLAVCGGLLDCAAGSVVSHPAAGRPPVGWMFQQTHALANRTVVDNIALAALARGHAWSTARGEAAEVAAAAGLGSCMHTRAGRISGGERQRLGVARAVLQGASLLLADEPTASLDASLVDDIAAFLVEHASSDVATIIATHDERVAAHCHRVVRLVDGRVVDG